MSSTLSSFISSLLAGFSVLVLISLAVIWVSSNDKLIRS
jgi:hypothetical protein